MTDFWLNISWTILIAVATVLTDWIAGKFISLTRGLAAIRRSIDLAVADEIKIEEVKNEIERYVKRSSSALTWGSDLVTVAIGLDLATLGLWTSNKATYTFFQKWNTAGVNHEIQVWLILILIHLTLLLLSIVFKHLHNDKIESLQSNNIAQPFTLKWVPQNKFMLSSNVVGFVTLFSSFMIITGAV